MSLKARPEEFFNLILTILIIFYLGRAIYFLNHDK